MIDVSNAFNSTLFTFTIVECLHVCPQGSNINLLLVYQMKSIRTILVSP